MEVLQSQINPVSATFKSNMAHNLEQVRLLRERLQHVQEGGGARAVALHRQRGKLLAREQKLNSRLFVVDAGRNNAALRAKYPDRSHYAIVPGRIRVVVNLHGVKSSPAGYVSNLSVEKVNVPASYRRVFEAVPKQRPTNISEDGPRYGVTLAFGKRLEPFH